MTINLQKPDITELKPRITVFGVGGGGGNAVNNMITAGLQGVDFVVANTDAQALTMSKSERIIQLGVAVTEGLGAGSQPEIGAAAAEECFDEINDHLNGTHMCFVTAGMGGGTGTGAAPVVAKAARQKGILTVGVVTKPFHFEGQRRMRLADNGIEELQKNVDTLIVIPNQNLFRIANENTTFADAFSMADQVLYSGVACITDLMVKEGLINLDFADVRSVMREMGKAMMGTGEASGDGRAMAAAEAAIANPLLDETSMRGAQGLLISITGGRDMTLFEVDEAATRIREEVDPEANIILGATFDESLEGIIRVSVVATGIDCSAAQMADRTEADMRPAMASMQAQLNQRNAAAEKAQMETSTAPAPTEPEVADAAIMTAEAEIERELEIAAKTEIAAPQNRLFVPEAKTEAPTAAPVAPAPAMTQPEPAPMPAPEMPSAQAPAPESVMPEAPAPVSRMPQIEDFPATVQAEMDRVNSPAPSEAAEEKGAKGLFKRISSSLGMGEEDVTTAAQKAIEQQSPQPRRTLSSDQSTMTGARGNMDEQGRAAPSTPTMSEDEQLEIPAFLRRQVR
ncbi:MAG: cell division protein FtsZ [Rhizobiaceae bacterium]|nr:cell division protein FtsZ [Rhizobiaceae bacterium]